MNRIYQGRVICVEMKNRDEATHNETPWLPFDPDPKQAKVKWQATLPVPSKPGEGGWQHHQLFQDAVNP
ncbi:MAG TPA: hypothetical protein P5186_27410 [Candidatus Paceibacterota bacterium]|nr:hypothetical protein [Verrucomicrobiota bacterium]HRY51784.1 hypothetical protein [Candidatus Paceibacterota bacterium]